MAFVRAGPPIAKTLARSNQGDRQIDLANFLRRLAAAIYAQAGKDAALDPQLREVGGRPFAWHRA